MKKTSFQDYLPFIFLGVVAIMGLFIPNTPLFADPEGKYNSGDIAWILVASSLVFLMTPGLAFFYGGMVNRKNIIATMMQSFVATGVISVLWIVCGFSLSFGESIGGIIGNPTTFMFFKGVSSGAPWPGGPTIPLLLFALFQMKFAIITPALVVGATAERIRFTSYILFMVLFSIRVILRAFTPI